MADQQQLDIETQINKAIQARAALLQNQKALIADQIALAQEMCRALECQELDGYNERIRETRDGLLAASEATEELDQTNQDMERNLRKSSKTMDFFKGAAVGAALMIRSSFGYVYRQLKGISSLVGGALLSGFKIVKFAISGWSKVLGNLAEKGMQAANAGIGLRNAYESVRFEFGGLGSKEGKTVTGAFDKLRSSMGNVAGTGIRFQKIFGRGPDGLAAGLEYLTGVAEEMGPKFEKMAEGFAEATDEILVLGRSLGFTGEEFAAMGTIAGYTGETMKQSLGRLQREIVSVSKAMNVNTKAMADNLKIMLKNPAVFGTSTKEMLKTSVAAQKLGMSIEDLQGPMGVFDDFPSAAQAAADLAAEFGLMVDATDMMTASPAEQMMMLKDAAQAAGIEFDNMSRQERKRLGELTNIDPNKMFELLDPTNAFDKSAQEEMSDGVDAATQATLNQSEATKELAKSMKRLHESMDAMNVQGGFFGSFIHGLEKGMMQSKEGRQMLRNITRAFKVVHEAGRAVGHMLMELFRPGGPMYFMYEYFSNLEQRMRAAMPKVKLAFRDFVNDLIKGGADAQNAFTGLLGRLKEIFLGDVAGGGTVQKAIMEGLHSLADLVLTNIINLAPYILNALTEAFNIAISLMSGNGPKLGVSLGREAILPMTQQAFAALMSSDVITNFGDAFMEMINKFWMQYGDKITDFLGGVLKAIVLGALTQALGPIVVAGIIKMALGGVGNMIKGLIPGGSQAAGAGGDMSVGEKIHEMAMGFSEAVKEIASIGVKDAANAVAVLAILGAGFGVGILALGGIALGLDKMGVSPVMMTVAAGGMVAISYAGQAAGKLVEAMEGVPRDPKAWLKAGAMMLLVAGLFGGVMYLTSEIIKELAGINPSDGLNDMVEAAAKLAMTGLVVTAGIVAMGAVLGVIAMLASGPQALILVAALAAAGLIFTAVMTFVTSAISDLAQFSPSSAKAAMMAAEAGGVLMDTVLKVLDATWNIMKNATWSGDAFDGILEKMSDLVTSISQKFMPAALAAADMVKGDPNEIKTKLSIVTDSILAFSPLLDIYTAILSIKDIDAEKAAQLIGSVSTGLTKVVTEMKGMITGIATTVGGFSKKEIERVAAAAPLIESIANVIGSLKMPTELFEDQMVAMTTTTSESGFFGGSEKNVQRVARGAFGAVKQKNALEFMVNLLKEVKEPLADLVQTLATIKFKGSHKEIKKNMGTVSAVMIAAGDSLNAIKTATQTLEAFGAKGTTSVGQAFANVRYLLQQIKINFAGKGGVFETVAGITEGATARMGNMSNARIKNLDNTISVLEKTTVMMQQFTKYSELAPKVLDSVAAIKTLEGAFTDQTLEPIIQFVDAIAAFDTAVNASLADIIPIDVLVGAIGDKLDVKNSNGQLTINRENVDIKINFSVTLDAQDVVKTMIKTDLLKKSVAGTKLGSIDTVNDIV